MVGTDIFKISSELFSDAVLTFWRAIGHTVHVPSLFRSGLPAPVYKQKGDPALPTNKRLVCLTSALRRLISIALTHQLTSYYPSLPMQWGFQSGTNPECAICFASNKLRRELPMAVILYLRKAYDSVQRQILQTILDGHLPHELSISFRPLLLPMLLQTNLQQSTNSVRTLVGMPQGDPPSPLLFNLFMDDYIMTTNVTVSRGLAILFVDDVLLWCAPSSTFNDY